MQSFVPNDAMSNFYNLKDASELYDSVMKLWINYENILTLIEVEKANGERMAELKPALLDFGNKTAGAMGSAAYGLAEQSRTNDLSNSIRKATGVMTSALT